MPNLLGVKPSYATGFAQWPGISEYPQLWTGLVGAWAPFLGITGSQLFDLSGNGNTGVRGGTGTIWTPSKFGLTQAFNGSDDYVQIDDTYYDSGVHSQIAISIWVYSTNPSATDTILSRLYYPFTIQITDVSGSDANFKASVRTDDTGYLQPTTTGYPLTAKKWHHIFLRYDGATCKSFLNGKEQASVAGVGNLQTDGDAKIIIGAHKSSEKYFTGKLGTLIIYNRAPITEIALLYHLMKRYT